MAYTTINKSTDYFNTKLYTGTGSSLALTGVGFQPDFVWIKPRNEARGHNVQDSVRGTGNLLNIDTNAEYTGRTQEVTSFDSDGFTVGTSNDVNKANNTHVAWNWKANGAGSANTAGSINSTVSVNTTAGFSIVSWTNSGSGVATVGHGLGVTPKMIIIKSRNETSGWLTYHESIGNTKGLFLNTTGAEDDNAELFNDTSPTSTVFTTGITGLLTGGSNLIAYCFAEKTGYSKFGSYTGNGNADGSFIYLGFKPAFVILKRTNGGTNDWVLYDTKRCINGVENALEPNTANSESQVIAKTDYNIDLLSNGFKPRSNSDQLNGNGDTYIYMAFGQSLVGSNNVPCTAR